MFYAVKSFLSESTIALLDENHEPITFYWVRESDINLGDIYGCRITKKMPNLKGCFAQIDYNRSIFVATKQPFEVGQCLHVIISKEERLGKVPQAKPFDKQESVKVGLIQKGALLYGNTDEQAIEQVPWTLELDEALLESIEPVIPFADGARLIFEQTHAFWSIDVDSGSSTMDLPALNKIAAQRIATEIVKRNISGNILVDFIGNKKRTEVATWKNILSQTLDKAPVPYQIIGISQMGNIEIRRERMRMTTYDATRTNSFIAYDLFKQILKNPNKISEVRISLDLYATLTGILKKEFDQVQIKAGDSIKLTALPNIDKFQIEYKP